MLTSTNVSFTSYPTITVADVTHKWAQYPSALRHCTVTPVTVVSNECFRMQKQIDMGKNYIQDMKRTQQIIATWEYVERLRLSQTFLQVGVGSHDAISQT